MPPIFTPPPAVPAIIELRQPAYGAQPVIASSHGYRYTITGNTLLSPATLTKALAAATDPKAALSALLHAYYDRGYVLVGATAQTSGHDVTISIIEGLFTEVNGDDVSQFFSGLTYRPGIKRATLLRDQVMASAYAARSGHTLNLNIAPAENPGGSTLTVNETPIADYFPLSGNVNFGNYGNRYTSGYVVGTGLTANLTHGVQISGNFMQGLPDLRQESKGSNYYENGIGASIVTPYGIYGANASWTHFRLGDITYPLNPDGNVFSYAITGLQLLYADTATRVSLNESFTRVKYEETVFNGFYTLLKQQYNYLSFGPAVSRNLTLAGQPGSLTASATFNLGISAANGTLVDNQPGVPTSHFRYGDLSFSYQQTLPHQVQATLSGQAQISADTLPSQQQWVLGGLNNLSAWEPGVISGDSGYVTRLEFDAPPLTRLKSSATLGAFIEVGGATLRTPASGSPPWQTLSDAGLTLKLTLPYQFSATAVAAVRVADNGFDAAAHRNLELNKINCLFVVQKVF